MLRNRGHCCGKNLLHQKFTYIIAVHDAAVAALSIHLRAVYDAAIVAIAMHAVPSRRTGDRCMRGGTANGTRVGTRYCAGNSLTESRHLYYY